MSKRIIMTRVVEHKTRYYSLSLFINLFGDYVVERKYGSISNKSHTGFVSDYFTNKDIALEHLKSLLKTRVQKGYIIIHSFDFDI